MKILKKEILLNIVTLGYSGYTRAKAMFEENSLRERVLLSDQFLGFMLVLPILSGLMLALGLLENVAELSDFFSEHWSCGSVSTPWIGVRRTT